MRLWNRFRRASAIGLAALAGCATSASTEPVGPRPAMWRVADHDTSIYLFGTVHLLPAGYQWRTTEFDRVTAASDTLVVETIIDEKNPQALIAELARLGFSPGLPPIMERVAPEKRETLRAAITKSGMPEAALNNMETWAAALALLQVQFQALGLESGSGVESLLKAGFHSAGKPIEQLESNAEQLGLFDKLPEAAQRELLEGAIDSPEKVKGQWDVMLRAWATGDVKAMARTFHGEFGDAPELRSALLEKRNSNWSRWLQQRMATPGTVLVAVGAGHLAGEDSVVDMLQERGLKVQRVQ